MQSQESPNDIAYVWVLNPDSVIHQHADNCKIKHTSVQKLTSSANRSMPLDAVTYVTAMTESSSLTNMNPLLADQTVLALVRYCNLAQP